MHSLAEKQNFLKDYLNIKKKSIAKITGLLKSSNPLKCVKPLSLVDTFNQINK